jgi:hypothetical protein
MNEWVARTLRLTIVCLAASALLIPPSLVGVGPSLPFAAVLGVVSAVCVAARDRLAALPTVIGYDLGRYGQDLWLAGAIGALVVILGPAGSPAELRALGGVVGLAGMINYFVRPIYLTAFSILGRRTGS